MLEKNIGFSDHKIGRSEDPIGGELLMFEAKNPDARTTRIGYARYLINKLNNVKEYSYEECRNVRLEREA
jgi:hypothetical protein